MAGNSGRRGAVRRGASKKGPSVGTGGHSRKALTGKGPTPKASERTGHPAARKAAAAQRRAASTGSAGSRSGGSRGGARRSGSTEYIAGRNSVVEALREQVPVKTVYVGTRIEHDGRVKEILKSAADQGIALLEVTKTDLDRMTDGALHQGVAAAVPAYEYAHPDDLLAIAAETGRAPLLVALDGVTDPRNLGAVIRSVAAFGGHGVIVPERRSAGMTAAAWKTSAGAAARIPVARATNLTRTLESLAAQGCFIAGLDAGGDFDLPGLEAATEPLVLVIGSEGKGLSRLVRETCDLVVSIPMTAGNESLNAGVAAGVALYEVARRRAE